MLQKSPKVTKDISRVLGRTMVQGSMWRGSSNACNLSLYRVLLSGRARRGHDRSLLPDTDLPVCPSQVLGLQACAVPQCLEHFVS